MFRTKSRRTQRVLKKGIDGEESRRKREEYSINSRKSKRDEQMQKRRMQFFRESKNDENNPGSANGVPQDIYGEKTGVPERATIQDLPALINAVNSDDYTRQLAGVTQFRKLLCIQNDPPIGKVVASGILPRLVELLGHPNDKVQFEAAWALTNIASGNSQQTKAVVDCGVVPCFIQLLGSKNQDVVEQAVWGLGNIAGDQYEFRDYVLEQNVIPAILPLCDPSNDCRLSLVRNATWMLSNCCRGKPQPDFGRVHEALPTLVNLLSHKDPEVLTDAAWALSYISDDNTNENVKISAVIEAGVVPRLIGLLRNAITKIQTPALRALGNIVTGTNEQTQCVLDFNFLPPLLPMLMSKKKTIRKEACWALSNITAGTKDQIQQVINSNFIPMLIEVLRNDEFDVQREVVWALSNVTSDGSLEQIQYLVEQGFLAPFCDALECNDTRLCLVILESLENVLKLGKAEAEKNNVSNAVCELIEECGGLDKIENLQRHDNDSVYQKAMHVLTTYFEADEEDESNDIAPTVSNDGGAFTFGTTGPASNGPSGGFQFSF